MYKLNVECGKDQRALFKVVNRMLGWQRELTLPIHESFITILNQFGAYFRDKIVKIRTELDGSVVERDFPDDQEQSEGLQMGEFTLVSVEDVALTIGSSPTKSCSLDRIPTSLLKRMVGILSPSLTRMINDSLSSGFVPLELKQALITPLVKKSTLNPELLSSYRPVSNLPFIAKPLQRIGVKRVNVHLTDGRRMAPRAAASPTFVKTRERHRVGNHSSWQPSSYSGGMCGKPWNYS